MNKEFCIMQDNPPYWRNFRFPGSERHEIFEGRTGNRDKSIEDGLVIFLSPELHRTGKHSIHMAPKEWKYIKRIAEITWCEYYKKNKNDFLERYGKNFI